MTLPPKPESRAAGRVSLLRYARLFRRDILSAQPERLYRAWMAEFRTPFFRSFLVNDPPLVREILNVRPLEFPKSGRIAEGLRPLLGRSVFVTNGSDWQFQRRIIDPAFEGGRLKDTFPAMLAAGRAAAARLEPGAVDVEQSASHAAADVIFRTLFSVPIENRLAARVYAQFRAHQKAQPILNLGAFIRLPGWMPRMHRRRARMTARTIRHAISDLTEARARDIAMGIAPDDLATKIMTTSDPVTGKTFDSTEMADQVAIFFLAGHETSASALSWTLYLLATHGDAQARVAAEASTFMADPVFARLSDLRSTRNVFREALRLYPPVPMMVRETTRPERFRGREVPAGAQIVISPWHLHRQARLWDAPDAFNPDRWQTENGRACQRAAYLPFSQGARVCPGAGFAMIEGMLLLACLLSRWEVVPVEGRIPVPVAHLTVRAKNGIWLEFRERKTDPFG